jgi:hypothetical protein
MKKHQFFFVPIIGAFLLIGCHNTPDAATAEKMVREANEKFQQQPYQTFEQNTSGDYVFINGEGVFATKEQMLQGIKDVKFAKWDLGNLKVRALDHVLVATGVNHHSMGGDDGKALTYQTAFTYIYQEKGGKLEQVAAQHTHVQNATKEEEAAIIKMLEADTKAFLAGDVAGLKSTWAFTPYTRGMAVSSNGQKAYGGSGDEMLKWVEGIQPTEATFVNSNYNIQINGNMAWATFDQKVTQPGKSTAAAHEVRCMEKINGNWRIVMVASLPG